MRVRLTQKMAERLDGIDLSGVVVGDVLELADPQALCLIRERWAVPVETSEKIRSNARPTFGSTARKHPRRNRA